MQVCCRPNRGSAAPVLDSLAVLSRFQTMRLALDHRAWLDYAPIFVSALITVLMALFYGIPVAPPSTRLSLS